MHAGSDPQAKKKGQYRLAGSILSLPPVNLFKPVLCSLIFLLLGTGFAFSAEPDDSTLFVEAINAYQKQDFLLSINKIESLHQLFPDTPLRDVSTLLLARACFRSGNNELAAKTISQFIKNYSSSPFRVSVEEELNRLGTRWQKGEKPAPNLPLVAAAQKVRNEQQALSSLPQQLSDEKPHPIDKSTQTLPPFSIRMPEGQLTVAAGQSGSLPFTITNRDRKNTNLILEVNSPTEYGAVLTVDGVPYDKSLLVAINEATPYKGAIAFHMPANKVNGQKAVLSLRARSTFINEFVQTQNAQVITAAPLIRVIARPEKQQISRGKQTRYRITVLNAGALPAQEVTIRVILPSQVEFLGAQNSSYHRETREVITFTVDMLQSGQLAEFSMDVRVSEHSRSGQQLYSTIEILNNQMLLKDVVLSSPILVLEE